MVICLLICGTTTLFQPSDRLKTEEELAKEEAERLQKLEVGNLAQKRK